MTGEWFVVFTDVPARDGAPAWWRWLHRRLRPGFKHCFAFGRASADEAGWVVVEWCFTRLMVAPITADTAAAWQQEGHKIGWTILRAQAREDDARPRLVVSCAGAVAALLGLPRMAWLPSTLYCQLVASGAVPISEADPVWAASSDHRK